MLQQRCSAVPLNCESALALVDPQALSSISELLGSLCALSLPLDPQVLFPATVWAQEVVPGGRRAGPRAASSDPTLGSSSFLPCYEVLAFLHAAASPWQSPSRSTVRLSGALWIVPRVLSGWCQGPSCRRWSPCPVPIPCGDRLLLGVLGMELGAAALTRGRSQLLALAQGTGTGQAALPGCSPSPPGAMECPVWEPKALVFHSRAQPLPAAAPDASPAVRVFPSHSF